MNKIIYILNLILFPICMFAMSGKEDGCVSKEIHQLRKLLPNLDKEDSRFVRDFLSKVSEVEEMFAQLDKKIKIVKTSIEEGKTKKK